MIKSIHIYSFIIFSFLLSAQETSIEIYFPFGVSEISVKQKENLKNWAYDLEGEAFHFKIKGFTDNVGNVNNNKRLAKLRSEKIKSYFQSLCLSINSISIDGVGEIKPYDGVNEKESPNQRKVEITALYKLPSNKNEFLKQRSSCINLENKKETVISNKINLKTENLSDSKLKFVKINKTFSDEIPSFKDLKKGDKLVFRGINFKPGTDKVTTKSLDIVRSLEELLTRNKSINIKISGHVCCGMPINEIEKEQVLKLSESRAFQVYDYLVRHGIEKSRMTYEGLGFSKPIVPKEKTEADENINRRVEIEITSI